MLAFSIFVAMFALMAYVVLTRPRQRREASEAHIEHCERIKRNIMEATHIESRHFPRLSQHHLRDGAHEYKIVVDKYGKLMYIEYRLNRQHISLIEERFTEEFVDWVEYFVSRINS